MCIHTCRRLFNILLFYFKKKSKDKNTKFYRFNYALENLFLFVLISCQKYEYTLTFLSLSLIHLRNTLITFQNRSKCIQIFSFLPTKTNSRFSNEFRRKCHAMFIHFSVFCAYQNDSLYI
jgi:hypothetical protein